jgi:PAS domain S-box-containing protein
MEPNEYCSLSESEIDAIREEAIDFAGTGLYRYKFDGTIVFADRGALRILGLLDQYPDPSHVCGKNIGDLIVYLNAIGKLREEIRRVGHVKNFENSFQTLGGQKRWVLHDSYLVVDPVTGEEEIQVIIRDITAQKLAQEVHQRDESRFKALVKMSQMVSAHAQDITTFAMDEGVQLTKSKFGYVAFVDEDESLLTMHSWSKDAMAECAATTKPLEYRLETTGLWGEAVRQRTPVITNDYAAPNPYKRGYPEGHVTIHRHMNVPVFDGDRIVAVAGVGNKEEEYTASDVRQLTLLMAGMWRIIKQHRFEAALKDANRTLKVLSAVNQVLVRAEDEMSLLREACGIICDIGGYRMTWIGFAEDDEAKTVRPICHCGHEDGYLAGLAISWGDGERGQGPTGTALRTGTPQIVKDTATDPRCEPWREKALQRGYASSISLPLVSDDSILGTLNIYAETTDAFNDQELELLTELAADLAYGIASLRMRVHHEEAERELQSQREDYMTIYDTVPAVIIYWGKDQEVVRANKAAAEALGTPVEKLVGKSLISLLPAECDKLTVDNIRVMESGKASNGIVEQLTLPNGESRWYRADKLPYWDKEGSLSGVIVFAQDITDRVASQQKRREMESHQREFYKRTIFAATQGKLLIADSQEIRAVAGPALESWTVKENGQLSGVRGEIRRMCTSAGMEDSLISDFLLCTGEAATNAIKHGGGGVVSIHKVADGLLVLVSDNGPGIENLVLPEATLRMGFSTAGSMGMGYKAIISIADKVYLATGEHGTTVAFEMKLHRHEMLLDIASLPDTWAM